MELTTRAGLDADAVRRMLPQRFPMLLLDRVLELVPGERAVGLKNVTVSEPYFQGHFPERSIVPGVMIIEVAAQLTALLLASSHTGAARIGYLAAVREFKFMKPVVPGDRLTVRVHGLQLQGNMARVDVDVRAEDGPVARGVLWVADEKQPTRDERGEGAQ